MPLVLDYEQIETNPGQYLNWYDAQQGDAPVINLDWGYTLAVQVRALYNQQNELSALEQFDNFLLERQLLPPYSAREGAGLFEAGVNSAYNLVATGLNTAVLPTILLGEGAEAMGLPPYMGGALTSLPYAARATSTMAGARMAASSVAKGSGQTSALLRGEVSNSEPLTFSGGKPNLNDDAFNPNVVNHRSAKFYELYGDNPHRGTLSNRDARMWYLDQEKSIPSFLNPSQDLKNQALQAFDLRNQFRTEARIMMQDRITADRLFREEKLDF